MIQRGPFVKGKPRKRNKDGTWRKKRSDAGKKREKTMKNEYIDKQVRNEIESVFQATNPPYGTGMIANYLLLQILDMLDNINYKLDMMNINIQDVEQAVLAKEQE